MGGVNQPTPDELGVATVADAMGGAGVLGVGLRWVAGPARLQGPAYTVQVRAGDNLGLLEAIERAAPGEVIVADCGGRPFGVWGEIATAKARYDGIAGLVLDGYIRDVEEVDRAGFPVWARGTAPRKTTKEDRGVHGEPIEIAGVSVAPGDLIVADRDGVVAVPAAAVADMRVEAAAVQRFEDKLLAAVMNGGSLVDGPGIKYGGPSG